MRQTNLTAESAEYARSREDLRRAEIELMRHRERVAKLRRALPPGPVMDGYTFARDRPTWPWATIPPPGSGSASCSPAPAAT